MASQRMILLAVLVLAVALGCQGGRLCRTKQDCPPCKTGEPLCGDGVCTCTDIKINNDDDGRLCRTKQNCPPCKTGEPLCGDGVCTCTDNYDGETPLFNKDDLVNEKHYKDKGCIVTQNAIP